MNEKERMAIEAEIRALLDQCYAAARKVDVDRTFAAFSVLPVGAIDSGVFFPAREDFVSHFREGFARSNGQDIELADTRIAVLAPNVAIATTHGHDTSDFKDGSTFAGDFAATFVFAKEGNSWKITHYHQSWAPPRRE